jgi:hypothetical protein
VKQLLIVGIDPGTTAGYAALDLNGRRIAARAAKELDRDTMLAELRELGSALIVATDKAKVPSFVADIATQLGAKVSAPAEDLLVVEKRALASRLSPQNSHELDALAAAAMAVKKHERLFARARNFFSENKRPELAEHAIELVVKQGISIRSAFDFLTAPHKPAVQVVRRAAEQKPLRADDYWKLYDSLTVAEQENALLRKQNRTLENLAGRLKRKVNRLKAAVRPETRIIRPTGELEQARRDNARLKQQLSQLAARQQRLQHALLNPDKYAIAKRMRTLGHDELMRVSRVLGIRQGDILFVEDCNSFSERVIDELAGTIELVVAVRPVKPKAAELLPFVILDSASIPHTQDEYFAFLDKPALHKARTDRELLRKLIEDYQQSRKVLG